MKKNIWIFHLTVLSNKTNQPKSYREDLDFDIPVSQSVGYARVLDIYSEERIVDIQCLNTPIKK